MIEHNELASSDLYSAWQRDDHVGHFGGWDRLSTSRLVKQCNDFNECQLFRALARDAKCDTMSDIGCANGRFYRYFRKTWPSISYRGFDISQVAIERAQTLYPDGDFRVFDGNMASDPDLPADLVFCRDVVHHQDNAPAFLSSLYSAASKYLLLRVRTKEVGKTNFNPEYSCQYTYGEWVPYIVFNTTELVDILQSFQPAPVSITVRRHPVILGGQASRFVPKELYYPDTGTAETAVLVEKNPDPGTSVGRVAIETCPEVYASVRRGRIISRAARRLGL